MASTTGVISVDPQGSDLVGDAEAGAITSTAGGIFLVSLSLYDPPA